MMVRGYVFLLAFVLIVSLFTFSVSAEGADAGVQNAIQAVQQVLQVVTQILGNLKTELETNQNAESARMAKINAPRLPEDPSGEQTPQVLGKEISDNRVAMNFTGMEITLEDRNTGNKLIIANRANVIGSFSTNKSLENTITTNTTTIVTKNGQDLGVVRVGNETTLIDSGSATTSSTNTQAIIKGFLPLVSAAEPVQNTLFSKQYVLFVQDDVFINGKNILFFPLKNYDQIIVNGSNLALMERDSDLIIKNEKSFYSRKVGQNDFFVNRIYNENNAEISFSLLSGGARGVYLVDNHNILSVGNSLTNNPLDGYENVSIPLIRFEMWKKATLE